MCRFEVEDVVISLRGLAAVLEGLSNMGTKYNMDGKKLASLFSYLEERVNFHAEELMVLVDKDNSCK